MNHGGNEILTMEQKLAQSEALLNHLRNFLTPQVIAGNSHVDEPKSDVSESHPPSQTSSLSVSGRQSPPRQYVVETPMRIATRKSPLRQQSVQRQEATPPETSPGMGMQNQAPAWAHGKFTPRNQPPSQRTIPNAKAMSVLSVAKPLDWASLSPAASFLDTSTQKTGDTSVSSQFQEYSASDIFEFAADINLFKSAVTMLFSREKKAQQRRDWDSAKAYAEYIERFRREVEEARVALADMEFEHYKTNLDPAMDTEFERFNEEWAQYDLKFEEGLRLQRQELQEWYIDSVAEAKRQSEERLANMVLPPHLLDMQKACDSLGMMRKYTDREKLVAVYEQKVHEERQFNHQKEFVWFKTRKSQLKALRDKKLELLDEQQLHAVYDHKQKKKIAYDRFQQRYNISLAYLATRRSNRLRSQKLLSGSQQYPIDGETSRASNSNRHTPSRTPKRMTPSHTPKRRTPLTRSPSSIAPQTPSSSLLNAIHTETLARHSNQDLPPSATFAIPPDTSPQTYRSLASSSPPLPAVPHLPPPNPPARPDGRNSPSLSMSTDSIGNLMNSSHLSAISSTESDAASEVPT